MSKKYSSSKNNKPDKQRALVLQGGGALGAYEVGVIQGLYEKLTQQDEENGLKDSNNSKRSLFDIIAGTSIGAMNGAVLVSQFLKAKERKKDDSLRECWKTAINELENFWKKGIALKVGTTSNENMPPLDMFPMFHWWKLWNRKLASEEAARIYYSTKEFVFGGTKVFSTKAVRPEDKFGDPDVKWVVLNDEPLQNLIEQFGKFHGKFQIGTSFDRGEPRLLVTAVDIAEGITVTFDSYKKSDGKRKTVYYSGGKYGHKKEESRSNDKDNSKQIVIEYENGITI